VAEYLERFGHRAGESLWAPTEAEDSRILAAHLRRVMGRRAGAGASEGAGARAAEARDSAGVAVGTGIALDPARHAAELEQRARTELGETAEFDAALALARGGRPLGDESEGDVLDALSLVRLVALAAAPRLVASGRLARPADVWFLEVEELVAVLEAGAGPGLEALDRRRREHRWAEANPSPDRVGPAPAPTPGPEVLPRAARPVAGAAMWAVRLGAGSEAPVSPNGGGGEDGTLRGTPGSPGRAVGTVRIVRGPQDFGRVQPGDVLVSPITMASWSPVFAAISALVTERGGPLSHPATLAREYGLPAVLAVPGATEVLADGAVVEVDGAAGTVRIL
jgi:pyruvate,water dikinase